METKKPQARDKCFIDTTVYEVCPSNCKSVIAQNPWGGRLKSECIAIEKLRAFMNSENSFSVAISAFQQASPHFIEEFARKSKGSLDLIRYFLNISDQKDINEITSAFSNRTLLSIIELDLQNFSKMSNEKNRAKLENNYFKSKNSLFWNFVSSKKICNFIHFLMKEKEESSLAAQFLLVLPPEIISQLENYANLSDEDEKTLYHALGDGIYELPLKSPKIYQHLLELFKDDLEIFFILQTMEELVKRKAMIINTTEIIISGYKKHGYALSFQAIYSELYGMEIELIVEILGQLRERNILTLSEKNSLQRLFESGGIDFIKGIKTEILGK
ncbi:MAG: hypothetical protein L6Q54_12520 [Leptospiraceae bacterium]|nr:hypothetical protein [Leptospiraceae bacterium]MCK6382057.1 hypothetical protein [Leptospiraceae bacterium]NUM41015.1 hypothetical protein [Leptospiraceae bacterium]